MVRPGCLSDVEACIVLAQNAWAESPVYSRIPLEPQLLLNRVLNDPSYVLFVSESEDGSLNGMFLGQLTRGLYTSDAGLIASNVLFYVLPHARRIAPMRLIAAFEKWAEDNDAAQIHLTTSGTTLRNIASNMRLFDALGYTLNGIQTHKVLK